MRIAVASMASMPPEFRDDEHLVDLLRARAVDASIHAWDDDRVGWREYDLVVIRSTWDYSRRRDQFLVWADEIGARLHNPPALVRWNSDKSYLRDLAAAGLRVVETSYIGAGEPVPVIDRDSVVKPTVCRRTRHRRFGADQTTQAEARIAGTAMQRPGLQTRSADAQHLVLEDLPGRGAQKTVLRPTGRPRYPDNHLSAEERP